MSGIPVGMVVVPDPKVTAELSIVSVPAEPWTMVYETLALLKTTWPTVWLASRVTVRFAVAELNVAVVPAPWTLPFSIWSGVTPSCQLDPVPHDPDRLFQL